MNQLAPLSSALPMLFEEDIAEAREFAAQATAASTLAAYSSDIRLFVAWCRDRGAEPLPASPASVAAFLAAQARTGKKASSIGRAVAAIAFMHRRAGFPAPPTGSEVVAATMRGSAAPSARRPTARRPSRPNASAQ